MASAQFTGTVVGRNHRPHPLTPGGDPDPQDTIQDVVVTIRCPALGQYDLIMKAAEANTDAFEIGTQVSITIAEVAEEPAAAEEAPDGTPELPPTTEEEEPHAA